jgi:hypothetical protein
MVIVWCGVRGVHTDCFLSRVQGEGEHDKGTGVGRPWFPWIVKLSQEQPGRFEESDVASTYIIALYWAMATALTIGYSDLTPQTSTEQVFAVLTGKFYEGGSAGDGS